MFTPVAEPMVRSVPPVQYWLVLGNTSKAGEPIPTGITCNGLLPTVVRGGRVICDGSTIE